MGVDKGNGLYKEQGAGDQGLMFGYASDETPEFMPTAHHAGPQAVPALAESRKNGTLDFLRPDGKSQVTIEYEGGMPKRVDAVVIATQHKPDVDIHRDAARDRSSTHVVETGYSGQH